MDDRAWSVDYFRGALDAARQEVEEIEKALGLPEGVHITLWSRLDQWEMLLRQYESDLKERGVGD